MKKWYLIIISSIAIFGIFIVSVILRGEIESHTQDDIVASVKFIENGQPDYKYASGAHEILQISVKYYADGSTEGFFTERYPGNSKIFVYKIMDSYFEDLGNTKVVHVLFYSYGIRTGYDKPMKWYLCARWEDNGKPWRGNDNMACFIFGEPDDPGSSGKQQTTWPLEGLVPISIDYYKSGINGQLCQYYYVPNSTNWWPYWPVHRIQNGDIQINIKE